MIKNYLNNTMCLLDVNVGYFNFDAGTLLQYIIDISQNSNGTLQDISFVFKKDLSKNLTLLAVGLDADGKFLTNKNKNFLLAQPFLLGTTLNPNAPLEVLNNTDLGTPCNGVKVCNTYNFNKALKTPVFAPLGQISQYVKDYTPPDFEPTTSFNFNAGLLANYIANTIGIQNVALVLARDGILRLIVVGVDPYGSPLYYRDPYSNSAMVLEHCYPCPSECPVQLPKYMLNDNIVKGINMEEKHNNKKGGTHHAMHNSK